MSSILSVKKWLTYANLSKGERVELAVREVVKEGGLSARKAA